MEKTWEQLQSAMLAKGYRVFTQGDYNVNIIGIRHLSKKDTFDDELYVAYPLHGSMVVRRYACTTEPGLESLLHPVNTAGTAILVPGQYRGMWKVGLHQGKYKALVQNTPVKVYRDNDRDTEYDMHPDTIQMGVFGINLHHASAVRDSQTVGMWSAGCQVIQKLSDFQEAMKIFTEASYLHGNSFTYTLLEEKDFQ